MRLSSFQVKNYRSIVDTGVIKLSDSDNISVFAGQNESGKSSILHALRDFESGEFDKDSLPFSTGAQPVQEVSCTYEIEENENFLDSLLATIADQLKLSLPEGVEVLDAAKIGKIKQFTISRIKENGQVRTELNDNTFNLFISAINNEPSAATETEPADDAENTTSKKYIPITETDNAKTADVFWHNAPKIIFFDDFCDLLPDSILISDLKDEKTDTKGYTAVRNLEKILNTNLVEKESENDAVREVKEKKDNDDLSINFQKDWGQRIHGENEVTVKYQFQKRDEGSPKGSYVNFYVETKAGQPLPPKQRSKGLIWFLSLWLELKAQDIENENLILLLDEPDQHLHVRAQKDILQLINKLATPQDNKFGDQIIYATHSPYLIEVEHLSRIKLILNTATDGTKIEDIVTSKINTEYKRDALQPVADAIGLSVSEFSTLNKRNVLLEGISDFYYFSAMKKILGKNNEYHFVPGIGVRQINNLISLSIGYGLEWVAIIDDDPADGGKDSKKKFDEIKDHVFDGDEETTKTKVHILEKIVGIENMLTLTDLKLVDSKLGKSTDMVKAVGKKRKVLFSKLFFEKVKSNEITNDKLSKTAKDNFAKAFEFIDDNLK